MRKQLILLILALTAFSSMLLADAQYSMKFTGAPGTGIALSTANTGIGFHKITWVISAGVSACQVQLDSSIDGVTWTSAGVIASQTCTFNGNTAITPSVATYVRINVTSLTGGNINVTWNAYVNDPTAGGGGGGGGGGVSGTIGRIPIFNSATSVGNSAHLSESGANVITNGPILPNADNTVALGSASFGYSTLWTHGVSSAGAILPVTAGGSNLGTAALPFGDVFIGGSANHSLDFTVSGLSTNRSLTAQDASGTISIISGSWANNDCPKASVVGGVVTFVTSGASCASAPSAANLALSNLSAVAINTTLLPGAAGAENLGTAPLPFGDVFIGGSANHAVDFVTSGLTTNRALTVQDGAGSIAILSGAFSNNDCPKMSASGGVYTLVTSSSGCANTALSNLASVAINTTLLPGAAGAENLGTAPLPFGDVFIGGSANHAVDFNTAGLTTNRTLTVQDGSGSVAILSGSFSNNDCPKVSVSGGVYTLVSSGGVCAGATGANLALSNLASVAINTTLLPGGAGAENLGTAPLPFGDVFIGGSANKSLDFDTSALTTNRTLIAPNLGGTLALTDQSQSWTGVPTFNNGIVTASLTFTPSGPIIFGGLNSTCGTGTSGQVLFCLGDNTSKTGQLSENGDTYRSFALWLNTSPTQHGVVVATSTTPASGTVPYVNSTGAGTAGQVLTSNGASSDPSFQDPGAIGPNVSLGTDGSVAGTLTLSNGAGGGAHTIWASGATTTNTIAGFTAVPTTGHVVDVSVSSTTATLHDSGITSSTLLTNNTNYATLREDFIGMDLPGDVTTNYIGRGWFGTPIGTGNWYTYGIATPAGSGGASADYNHPGVVELYGLATNDGVVIHTGKTAGTGQLGNLSAYAGWDAKFVFRLATVSGSTNQVYVGFGAATIGTTVPQTNWFGCRFDQLLGSPDTTVKFVSSSSSTLTTADSTIAPGTTWHTCRIRSTVAGTLLISLDGGSESSISTNVPANAMDAFFEYKNSANVTTDMWADLFQFYQTVTR